mgnify:CR=1 FL=1
MWFIWLILMIGLGVAFYLVLSLGAKSTVDKQFLRRQQTIARAEAGNLAAFFSDFGGSVAVLAQLRTMEQRDANTVRVMEAFVDQWRDRGLVGGIVLTDGRGIVQFNANVTSTSDVGASLADRDYFVRAKGEPERGLPAGREGEFFVSKPVVSRLGASKGQIIVVAASPVHQNGVFTGVVAASVKLKPLTERYLELMKIFDSIEAFLIGQEGDVWYDSTSSLALGTNIFEAGKSGFLGSQALTDAIKDGLRTRQGGELETPENLVAWAPVQAGDRNWLLVVTDPKQAVAKFTAPFLLRQIVIFLVVSLGMLLFGILTSREIRLELNRPTTQKSS